MKHKTFNRGFTLIELLVAISIIGLLSSIVFSSVSNARAKARDARRISDFKQIQLALEFFYDTYGRYPITAGHTYWDGHWMNFQTCLETGSGCGFGISGYESVLSDVPQDPLDSNPNTANNGTTYYYNWVACDDQMYVLRTRLETNNPVLDNDADGAYYFPGYPTGCDDPFYCIKQNWCY
jgi:prepilin-type N-terminal cleavage/methylation domain-containing protein